MQAPSIPRSSLITGSCALLLICLNASAQLRAAPDLTARQAGAGASRGRDSASISSAPTVRPTMAPASAPDEAAQATGSIATGSYVVDVTAATIHAGKVDNITPFDAPAYVPASARITSVSWKYAMVARPRGFQAALCWRQRPCIDVTLLSSGRTDAFNGLAASGIVLRYHVIGNAPLPAPLPGQAAQLIVSYSLPR